MKYYCTVLLLLAHPRSVAAFTKPFTTINKSLVKEVKPFISVTEQLDLRSSRLTWQSIIYIYICMCVCVSQNIVYAAFFVLMYNLQTGGFLKAFWKRKVIQLNDQTVLFQAIQFSLSRLFPHSLNVKKFYLIHRYDPLWCYHSGSKWAWERWHWRGTPHSPKLQYYWILTIRFLNGISRTLVSAEMQSVYSSEPHTHTHTNLRFRDGW